MRRKSSKLNDLYFLRRITWYIKASSSITAASILKRNEC